MREIKFRAYHKRHRQMFVIFDNTNGKEWFLPNAREDFEVMQFTGLLDKSGLTDIYEGDIIDIMGLVRGNIYESLQDPRFRTDIIVTEMGTKAWRGTEQRLLGRGCKYAL